MLFYNNLACSEGVLYNNVSHEQVNYKAEMYFL